MSATPLVAASTGSRAASTRSRRSACPERPGLRKAVQLAILSLQREDDPALPSCRFRRPIILVHGFASTSRVFLPLQRRLERSLGRTVLRVNLGGLIPLHTQDIRKSARVVNQLLEQLSASPDFEFADVVGHSMGGLVAAYLLKFLDRGKCIRRVVTLGTPHRGTPSAVAGVVLLGLFNRAVWQMLPGSRLIRELEQAPLPEGCDLVSIAGAEDSLVPRGFTTVVTRPGHGNEEVGGANHWELLFATPAFDQIRAVLACEPKGLDRGGQSFGYAAPRTGFAGSELGEPFPRAF